MTAIHPILVARVYDPPAPDAGARLLVDRLWPRGISHDELPLDGWMKDATPSDSLRHWFHAAPGRDDEFVRRYRAELDSEPEAVERCLDWCRKGPVTLLTSARNTLNARVLQDYLAARMAQDGAGNGTGGGSTQ